MPTEPFIATWTVNGAVYVVVGGGAIWRYKDLNWMIVGNVDLNH